MMYRLKHTPTGLYYQPHKHRGSHLSKRGKIYQLKTHGLSEAFKRGREVFHVECQEGSQIHKITKDVLGWVPVTWKYRQLRAQTLVKDWEIEIID